MDSLWQDIRYGWRSLRGSRSSTWIAIAALAVGIGANVAIFSVVNAVLLRPLPYADSDRLVFVWGNFFVLGIEQMGATPAEFVDYRDENQSFDDVAAFTSESMILTGIPPERLPVARVTPNLMPLLGGRVILGRPLEAEDAEPGAGDVAVLSHATWSSRFGAAPDIVGKPVTLDGRTVHVIGVLAEGFEFPHAGLSFAEPADLLLPLAISGDEVAKRSGRRNLRVLAHLKPGTTMVEARADMSAIAARLEQEQQGYRGPNGEDGGWRITVVGLQDQIVGKSRPAMLVLLGLVGLVLLIACANVANLQIVRATRRRGELAMRAALGASRGRILRQLLVEGLLLSVAGGAIGLLLAAWGMSLLPAMAPADLPRIGEVTIDGRVLAFAVFVTLVTALGFGLVPSLRASRFDVSGVLKASSGTGATRGRRAGEALVVVEIALALFVLVSAGAMTRTFVALQQAETGMSIEGVFAAKVSLPASTYTEPVRSAAFSERVATGIRLVPGIESAAVSNILPLGGSAIDDPFSIEGRPLDMRNPTVAGRQSVTPSFFQTIGVTVLAGREFTDQDVAGAMPVAIVNERMARAFFDGDALGQRIKLGAPGAPGDWRTIVGVVGNVPHRGIGSDVQPDWYAPIAQSPSRDLFLVVRSRGDAAAVSTAIRNRVLEVDPGQPVTSVRRLDDVLAESVAPRRFAALLALLFGAVALGLAVIGVFGVMQNAVTERTREVGIRLALGARPTDIRRMVVGRGLLLTIAGMAVGSALAFACGRFVAAVFGQTGIADPATLAMAALLLAAVSFVACLVPARRASGIDPVEALHRE